MKINSVTWSLPAVDRARSENVGEKGKRKEERKRANSLPENAAQILAAVAHTVMEVAYGAGFIVQVGGDVVYCFIWVSNGQTIYLYSR